MPLPLILGIAAAVAATGGVGSGIHGAVKMKKAKDIMKSAKNRHDANMERFDKTSRLTGEEMDKLGELELEILHSFEEFADTIEKIQNRPQFREYDKDGVKLPQYDKEELKKVSVGAGILLGGLGGAAAGAAGGFAAAGATTSAVMALGVASTGTAIASLSGAAATNATLAAIGGGAVACGGGGIALGTTILGATTLGVGLLVGGIIFSITGGKLSDKAEEAWEQMEQAEKKIDKICAYLDELKGIAEEYRSYLTKAYHKYQEFYACVSDTVNNQHKTNWNDFSEKEKLAVQNTVLLVGLLFKMCQINLVKKSENKEDINEINHDAIEEAQNNAASVLGQV